MKFFFDSALIFLLLLVSFSVLGQNPKLNSVISRSNKFDGLKPSLSKIEYKYDLSGILTDEIKFSTRYDTANFSEVSRRNLIYSNGGNLEREDFLNTNDENRQRLSKSTLYTYVNNVLKEEEEIFYDYDGNQVWNNISYFNLTTGVLDSTIYWLNNAIIQKKEVYEYFNQKTEISVFLNRYNELTLHNVEVLIYSDLNQIVEHYFKYDDFSLEYLFQWEYDYSGNLIDFKQKREIYGTNEYELFQQIINDYKYNENDDIVFKDQSIIQYNQGNILQISNYYFEYMYYCDGPLRKSVSYAGNEFLKEEVYNYDKKFDCFIDEELSINVFPNPSSNLVFLESEYFGNKWSVFGVFDITGKEVVDVSSDFRNNLIEIDISEFATGYYLVKITNGEEIKSIKFLKI